MEEPEIRNARGKTPEEIVKVGVALITLWLLAINVNAQEPASPPQASPVSFSGDASQIFGFLSGQASIGLLFDRVVVEGLARTFQLSKTKGDQLMGTWWGTWEGQNATGSITMYAAFPDLTSKKENRFWVTFDPPADSPIAPALLSHLIAKAREVIVSGGDIIDLELPFERPVGGCSQRYTYRVRLAGALLRTTVNASCPVFAGARQSPPHE